MTAPGRRRFCAGCKSWTALEGHSCPADDGDRTVVVSLAALRALALDARQTSTSLDDHFDGEPVALRVTEGLVAALGVPELLERVSP